jgi:hypothetical protein
MFRLPIVMLDNNTADSPFRYLLDWWMWKPNTVFFQSNSFQNCIFYGRFLKIVCSDWQMTIFEVIIGLNFRLQSCLHVLHPNYLLYFYLEGNIFAKFIDRLSGAVTMTLNLLKFPYNLFFVFSLAFNHFVREVFHGNKANCLDCCFFLCTLEIVLLGLI